MKVLIDLRNMVILTVILILCSVSKAHAYIDPGTGSYIIQVVIGVLLGAAYALKVYWEKVRAYFSKIFSKRTKSDKNEN